MRAHIRHWLASQRYFSALSLLLLLHINLFFLHRIGDNFFVSSFLAISGAFFLVVGSGISITIILQWLLKRKFDWCEFLSLSFVSSLLIPPLLLNLEFSLFKNIAEWYPLANNLLLWSIASTILYFNRTTLPPLPKKVPLRHPLIFTLLFGIVFILVQVLSFQPLPDLDPYKWLFKYTYQFASHLLDSSERPLFGSYIYIATTGMGVSIFHFFKYVLPFLVLMTIFPAWMVARTFLNTNKQWIFLLFIFSMPNAMLYVGTAMPQVPFIILSYFFIFFLLYSSIRQDDFFLYAAGISIFLTFFHHQAAFIVLLAWVIPVIFAKRKPLLSNKKILFLIVLVLLVNLRHVQPMYEFATHWISQIFLSSLEKSSPNWLYPTQYSNVDRNAMGWNSISGVIQFYAFYIGPMLGLILCSFMWLVFQKTFRVSILKQTRDSVALSVALCSFLIFFTIAEILPRFPGIALLPDRAWIFGGIFSYIFLYLILKHAREISSKKMLVLILFFLLGIFGALYINYLKRYLISPLQLESAEWIQSHLPQDRVFLSYGYRSLLPVHANTPIVNIPNDLYCETDTQAFQTVFKDLQSSTRIKVINPLSPPPPISAPIANRYIYSFNTIPSLDGKPLYIYYSQVHLKNPYRERPYSMKTWGIKPCPDGQLLFDRDPDTFQRIYNKKDAFDEVIIWKIL